MTVDNRYKDLCAQLDSKIQSARDALNAEVAKLNDTDKDLYKEMSDLKEKQADYYARLENIKLTHEHDKQALEAQIDKLVNSLDEEVKKIYLELQSRKQALATQEIMKNWEQKMLTQLRDLNTHDQQYDSRNSTLNELQHAAYKNSIWQSNTLGQMFAAQTVHSAMVAQQMYADNMRQDEIDYKKAKAIHDSRKINESGASELEAKGSVGNNFIEQFINR